MPNHSSQWFKLEKQRKAHCNCVFHIPGSHRVEGISFIFFSYYFLSSRCLFLYDCGECVLYSLGQVPPGATLAKCVALSQEQFQPLVSFFGGLLLPETSVPPQGLALGWVSQRAQMWGNASCQGWAAACEPRLQAAKTRHSGHCGRVSYTHTASLPKWELKW